MTWILISIWAGFGSGFDLALDLDLIWIWFGFGFGLIMVGFGLIWLGFHSISVGFGLAWAGFRLGFRLARSKSIKIESKSNQNQIPGNPGRNPNTSLGSPSRIIGKS